LVIDPTVGSVVVVVESPLVEHPTGFLQAEEQLSVKQLVTQPAIKAFDVAIFPRAPLGDVQRLNFSLFKPTLYLASNVSVR